MDHQPELRALLDVRDLLGACELMCVSPTGAMREQKRCLAAVARGGSIEFWVNRQEQYLARAEKAAAIIRQTIQKLTEARR